MQFTATIYAKAQPQGSMKAFVRGNRAIITSANAKMKPYRQEVAQTVLEKISREGLTTPLAGKHVPVGVIYDFTFRKPESVPKARHAPAVKPDIDKLIRSTTDALTGILWHDDAQIVEVTARKIYGEVEQVHISAWS